MNIIMIIITILHINTAVAPYQFKSTSFYNKENTIYTEKPIYTIEEAEESNNSNNKRPGPRKVSGIDGWLTWLMWGADNGVPSNASNQDMYDYYNYIQNGGNMNYNDWWNNKYNPTPLGDNIYILMLFILVYIGIKKLNNRSTFVFLDN